MEYIIPLKKVALIVDHPERDLPGMILVALKLCNMKYNVFLVPHNIANSELLELTPDFVLFNYLRTTNEKVVRKLIVNNISYGVLDTEGGLFGDLSIVESTLTTSSEILEHLTVYFTWGKSFANYLSEKINRVPKNKLRITGAPRFDFFHKDFKKVLQNSQETSSTFDDYTLINTAFPIANPRFKTPEQELNILINKFGCNEDLCTKMQNAQKRGMEEMVKIVKHLAKNYPNESFVLRPHPFENCLTYNEALKEIDNIFVIQEGTVDKWIINSRLLIQLGCSTAVEASFVEVPVLMPGWINGIIADPIIEKVSIVTKDIAELSKIYENILTKQYRRDKEKLAHVKTIIKDVYYKVDGKAHTRVANHIHQIIHDDQPLRKKNYIKLSFLLKEFQFKKHPVRAWLKIILVYCRLYSILSSKFGRKKRSSLLERWQNSPKFFNKELVQTYVDPITSHCNQQSLSIKVTPAYSPLRALGSIQLRK